MADLFSNIANPISKANTGGWTVNAGGGASIDDWVTIGVNGGIFQGTGTPASPTTGLKIYNSSGIGLIEMWKAGAKTFYVDTNGDVTLSGTITASAGSIGGWTIGSGLLTAGTGSDAVGLAPGSYPFYAGNATAASAPFRVSKAGALTASSVTITAASAAVSLDSSGLTLAATNVADFASIPAAQLVKYYSSTQSANVAAMGAWAYTVATPYMNLVQVKSYQGAAGGHTYYASTRLYANAAYLNLHEATDASGGGITANVGIATSGALYVGSSSQLNLDGLSSGQVKATGQIIATTALIGNEGGGDNDSRIESDGNANMFYVDAGNNRVGIGTATPTGLFCIDQGADDTNILELRSSDVDHGMTTYGDTSSFGTIMKDVAATGGLKIRGLTGAATGIVLTGWATNNNTTKSTSGNGAVNIHGGIKSGTGVTTMGADANILTVKNYTTTVWIVDEDGDTWQNGDCSALSFTDRTPIAKSLTEAQSIITSHKPKAGSPGQLDHAALHPAARVEVKNKEKDEKGVEVETVEIGRNLSLTVSAAAQVITDLMDKVEKLTSRIAILEKGS